MKLRLLRNATLKLEIQGRTILIDPYGVVYNAALGIARTDGAILNSRIRPFAPLPVIQQRRPGQPGFPPRPPAPFDRIA